MRTLFFYTLAISSMSFSFYKLQGPFIIPARSAGQPTTKQQVELIQEQLNCSIPNDILNHKAGSYDIPFLIDPVTTCYIIATPLAHNLVSNTAKKTNFIYLNPTDPITQVNMPNGNDPIYDFLKCNFKYKPENFWKIDNLKQYESITSGRNVGPLLFGQTSMYELPLNKIISPQHALASTIIQLLNQQYHVDNRKPKEYITYYSKETSDKYPLMINNQEYIPSYKQPHTEYIYINPLRLREKFTLNTTNIEIYNQIDGVKLYKNDQYGKTIRRIDLKSELLNYYNNNYFLETEFATRLKMDKKGERKFNFDPNTMAWAATQFDRPILQPQDYELLQNSTILTVWTVRSDTFKPKESKKFLYKEERQQQQKSLFADKPVHNLIIGLAKDNRTGELFHWVTDLKRDIEVLFSLESSRRSENQNL